MRPFRRIRQGKLLNGTGLGLAVYTGWDVRLVRIGLVALAVLNSAGLAVLVLYLILGAITPMVDSPTEAGSD